MNTFTPELSVLKNAAPRQFEEREQAMPRQIVADSNIVLFVGQHMNAPEFEAAGYKCFFAQDFDTAMVTMEQLQSVFRRKPCVIIYRSHIDDQKGLYAWKEYLRKETCYSCIPFLLYVDVEEITPEMKVAVKNYAFIDEIITVNCLSKLPSKISFISKFKQLNSYPPLTVLNGGKKIRTKRTLNAILKRTFDIVVASCAIIVISPLLMLIATIIKLESKGPVFYAARRAGRNYQVFKFFKFRTMVADADKKLQQLQHLNQYKDGNAPVFYKVSNDPRVTRFGAFLRNTSLDELPQLFNVLIGDMSLVGNRPLPLYEASALTTDEWAQRFLAPAGITGLWQISKRGKKDMSVEERIALDIDYSNSHSFTYDMWIMANTPKALIQKDNV
ncbi:sugar transferase [Chitinophaga sp. CF418]|uniref:sugar transferase n=1 Tax=Chitinophaga sp. CF418 TaxID=1855287 RepID=UPI0009237A9D|nr:sugar transferase [Chitinophaga sp. CF418]SHN44363.1 Sugar transferase involved in LPS biosynthesis (colanic, teichoic acid) [Chitinophaga sp. CF418]